MFKSKIIKYLKHEQGEWSIGNIYKSYHSVFDRSLELFNTFIGDESKFRSFIRNQPQTVQRIIFDYYPILKICLDEHISYYEYIRLRNKHLEIFQLRHRLNEMTIFKFMVLYKWFGINVHSVDTSFETYGDNLIYKADREIKLDDKIKRKSIYYILCPIFACLFYQRVIGDDPDDLLNTYFKIESLYH